MNKEVWVRCQISQSAFRNERIFTVSTLDGRIHRGAVHKDLCDPRDLPPEITTANQCFVRGREISRDGDRVVVNFPDGEVFAVHQCSVRPFIPDGTTAPFVDRSLGLPVDHGSDEPDTPFVFSNLGPIREASIVLRPLTILVGDNGTGKTLLARKLLSDAKERGSRYIDLPRLNDIALDILTRVVKCDQRDDHHPQSLSEEYLSFGFLPMLMRMAPSPYLLAEEPETGLSIPSQILMAQMLVRIVNRGFTVILVTHSDMILQQINNCIKIGTIRQYIGEGKLPPTYTNREEYSLSADDVAAYQLDRSQDGVSSVTRLGVFVEEGIVAPWINEHLFAINKEIEDLDRILSR